MGQSRIEQIAGESETSHQRAFIAWCRIAAHQGVKNADMFARGYRLEDGSVEPYPPLEWIHAIPNGGSRGDTAKARQIRGAQLKAEGVKPGVADIFLPYPCGGFAGLYIEFKKPSLKGKGGLSPLQLQFAEYCHRVGYFYEVAYDWKEAVELVKNYLQI